MTAPTRCTLLRVFYGGHTQLVTSVALSPNGARLASCGADGRVVVWDVATGRCLAAYPQKRGMFKYTAFSPTGAQLACASWRKHVCVVDIESGQALMDMPLDHGASCTAWTPDGLDVVCGCYKGIVERWAVATGERVWQTMHHADYVNCVALTPDGQTGASGSWDRTVRLWRTDDGQLLRTVQTECTVWCLALAPDGQRVASGMTNGALALWDVATGQLVHELRGHLGPVQQLMFTPCGQRIISTGADSVRTWDVTTGQMQQTVVFEPNSIRGRCLAPDGTVMVATVSGTDVVLWRVSRHSSESGCN